MDSDLAAVLATIKEHIAHDEERFKKLDEIHADVKSLLVSRAFQRGAARAAFLMAAGAGSAVPIIVEIARWLHRS